MSDPLVTVVTPTLLGREDFLERAAASVRAQTVPCRHLIGVDLHGDGPAAVRNRLLADVTTPWTAFLDDDDELAPHHVDVLLDAVAEHRACLAYPWFDTVQDGQVVPHPADVAEGVPFRADWLRHGPNFIPVTVLARTSCVLAVGAFPPVDTLEDYGLWLRLVDAGCKLAHVPQRTWRYHVHAVNRHQEPVDVR